MRTRTSVSTLVAEQHTDWPAALVSYRKGVAAMRGFDPPDTDPPARPTDRRSWQYLAAVHGRATDGEFGLNLDKSDPLWSKCQHGSWFFFPWHRMYLLTLESYIQHFSGDTDWAVPYWYAVDPDNPASDVLPAAFLDPSGDNALYTKERSTRARTGQSVFGTGLRSQFGAAFIQFLRLGVFSAPHELHTPSYGYGGAEYTKPDFNHGKNGAIESVPHGVTHNYVGSDYNPSTGMPLPPIGLMTELQTAARDPIFWLHHANIDRFWQMWLDLDPTHKNPDNDAWLNSSFKFPTPDGGTKTWQIGQVLDTTAADLNYKYDTVAPPSAVAAAARIPDVRLREVVPPMSDRTPAQPAQVIGATVSVPILADHRAHIRLSAPAVRSRALTADLESSPAQRWLLSLEGVTGTIAAPAYSVYVNLPPGAVAADHPERMAGIITTFGVGIASRPRGEHSGSGLSFVLDITGVHDALEAAGQWDPASISVAFVPQVPPAADDDAFAERLAAAPPVVADVRVARISVLVT